jgi:hypothetical protein
VNRKAELSADERRAKRYTEMQSRLRLLANPWREYTTLGHPWEMPSKGGSPAALRKLLFIYGTDEEESE